MVLNFCLGYPYWCHRRDDQFIYFIHALNSVSTVHHQPVQVNLSTLKIFNQDRKTVENEEYLMNVNKKIRTILNSFLFLEEKKTIHLILSDKK